MANCGICDTQMYCPMHRPAPGMTPIGGLGFYEVTLHTNDDEGTGRIIVVEKDNQRYRYGPGGILESVESIGPRSIPDPIPTIGVRTLVKARIARWRRRHRV